MSLEKYARDDERQIVGRLVDDALKAGYAVSVSDSEPGTDKLPSGAAIIEEALWDCGLVEDDAAGEVARALDAGIRPEIQAVLDETPDASDDAEEEDARPVLQRLAETANNLYAVSEVLDHATFQNIKDAQDALVDLVEAGRGVLAAWDAFDTDGPAPMDALIEALRAAIAKAGG